MDPSRIVAPFPNNCANHYVSCYDSTKYLNLPVGFSNWSFKVFNTMGSTCDASIIGMTESELVSIFLHYHETDLHTNLWLHII